MKKNLFLIFLLAGTAFSNAQTQTSVQEHATTEKSDNEVLPDIIKSHKDRASFTCVENGTATMIPLFNGKNLDGWYTYTSKYGKNNDKEKQFNVENGTIHLSGEPMGYVCTDKSYKNYYLRVVFRWGDKKYAPRLEGARDSGILYHFPAEAEDNVWPKSVECQVQENDCGDYWLVGGATAESPNPSSMEWNQPHIVRTANFEKPGKEWNTIEIICHGDKSEHYVNGHLVNHAYNLSISEGKILLQLEGAEVYYNTVELMPLK